MVAAPKPVPPLPAAPPAAGAPLAAAGSAKAAPGFVSVFGRRALTPEELAHEAEAKAREMAERAARQKKIASDAKKGQGGSRRGDSRRL